MNRFEGLTVSEVNANVVGIRGEGMSELLKLIQEADVVAFEMETAKAAVEAAKQNLETCKENLEQAKKSFDEVLVKADEVGIPRAKIKKLVEERTSVLVASGLIAAETRPSEPKSPKVTKTSRKKAVSESDEARDLPTDSEGQPMSLESSEESSATVM